MQLARAGSRILFWTDRRPWGPLVRSIGRWPGGAPATLLSRVAPTPSVIHRGRAWLLSVGSHRPSSISKKVIDIILMTTHKS
jgi:hypothetical protein